MGVQIQCWLDNEFTPKVSILTKPTVSSILSISTRIFVQLFIWKEEKYGISNNELLGYDR